MGIPRDFAKLEEAPRLEDRVDLFAPIERSGLRDSPLANALTEHLRGMRFPEPERTLRLCLQALRVQHEELSGRLIDAELVATLPLGMPGIARTTDQVLTEMLRPPVEEVILLGYELTDEKVMRLLIEVEAAGADVIVICDLSRVNYICRLASISFAGSPPWPGPVAGRRWCGSWGRQTPG